MKPGIRSGAGRPGTPRGGQRTFGPRPRLAGGLLALTLTALLGCIQVTRVVEDEKPVKTPDPFLAAADPDLASTDAEGWFGAPELDPNCYFYQPEKSWYRYWNRNWFVAYRWDGSWFLLPEKEVPAFLRGRVDLEPLRERAKSRTDRLRELEEKYEQLERQAEEEREREEREEQEGAP